MEPNLRYSWVSFCTLFVSLVAVLLHHSFILEWMRPTAPSISHISGKLPLGWHIWKHPSLGCVFKPTTGAQRLLCCSKQIILSCKRDGRGMWRQTPFRTHTGFVSNIEKLPLDCLPCPPPALHSMIHIHQIKPIHSSVIHTTFWLKPVICLGTRY